MANWVILMEKVSNLSIGVQLLWRNICNEMPKRSSAEFVIEFLMDLYLIGQTEAKTPPSQVECEYKLRYYTRQA